MALLRDARETVHCVQSLDGSASDRMDDHGAREPYLVKRGSWYSRFRVSSLRCEFQAGQFRLCDDLNQTLLECEGTKDHDTSFVKRISFRI